MCGYSVTEPMLLLVEYIENGIYLQMQALENQQKER